ncbi:hypothetical protein Y032_0538g3131 [Ancylostoma ceylanicum]|uniref:Uncharacterized protein n=1 Tax=Ancylostoma ceylanicum TaxID=53326 RepID=A0A016WQY3_9BILA|nr:hypothetical protein Y032_0538g3131 [Ancylostoma ceylanicum]
MDPPELIQKFSIRINNTYAKERSLEDFPEDLQNTLLDFGEDLAGYGADESKSNTLVDLSSSTFFKALGITFEQRKARLKELIDERMELYFGEDLAGYGADELKANTLVDLSSSTFFKALGITFEERKARLKELIDERMELREELFKALQRALRDVRSYSYEYYGPDNSRFRWIPNNRHAKARSRGCRDIQAADGEDTRES